MNTHQIRIHLITALCAALCSLPSVARAAESGATQAPRPAGETSATSTNKASAGGVAQTTPITSIPGNDDRVRPAAGDAVKTVEDFRGQPVVGVDRRSLGKVQDFMVDTQSGKIVYAVVAAGDNEDAFRLVQQSSLRPAAQGFASELDQAAFQELEALSAQQLDADKVARVPVQSQRVSEAVEQQAKSATPATTPAIGILPPAADSVSAATTAAAAHPDPVTPATTEPVEVTAAPSGSTVAEPPQQATHLVRASKLRGAEVRGTNAPLGSIEAIALDLEQGKATALLQLAGPNAGGETKFHVPLTRLQFAAADGGVSTTLTRSDFESARAMGLRASSRKEAGVPADSGTLTPTGRTADAGRASSTSPVDTSGGTRSSNATPATAPGEPTRAATAGSSDRSGGFNIDRAMSGRGVGGTPPDPVNREKDSSIKTHETPDPASAVAAPDGRGKANRNKSAQERSANDPQAATEAASAGIQAALQRDQLLAAEGIRVHEAGGKIMLHGEVDNEELKERAESVARKAAGGATIDNKIKVQKR